MREGNGNGCASLPADPHFTVVLLFSPIRTYRCQKDIKSICVSPHISRSSSDAEYMNQAWENMKGKQGFFFLFISPMKWLHPSKRYTKYAYLYRPFLDPATYRDLVIINHGL